MSETAATETDLKEIWSKAHDALHKIKRTKDELHVIDAAQDVVHVTTQAEDLRNGPIEDLVTICATVDVILGDEENPEAAREKIYDALWSY